MFSALSNLANNASSMLFGAPEEQTTADTTTQTTSPAPVPAPASSTPPASGLPIFATGDWRKQPALVKRLSDALNTPIHVMSQKNEGQNQATNAHAILKADGYVESHADEYYDLNPTGEQQPPVYVYIGAGRGSLQASVLNEDGAVLKVFKAAGFPKLAEGETRSFDNVTEVRNAIEAEFPGRVCLIFCFDAMFYQARDTLELPVLPDKAALCDWTTGGEGDLLNITAEADCASMGFLQDSTAPIIFVRNFLTKNGMMRKIHMLPGESGEYAIDLGSGKFAVVETATGKQETNITLPDSYATDDGDFDILVDQLRLEMYADRGVTFNV